jgi:hypothetical protein
MASATWLRDLGIVSLSQAFQDNALGVAQQVMQDGVAIRDTEDSNLYWCTLCSTCVVRRTAYRHRDNHWKQVQKDSRVDPMGHLRSTLDEKYGMCVLLMHHQVPRKHILSSVREHMCPSTTSVHFCSHQY